MNTQHYYTIKLKNIWSFCQKEIELFTLKENGVCCSSQVRKTFKRTSNSYVSKILYQSRREVCNTLINTDSQFQ